MALIAAVSWHFGSTRASKSASRHSVVRVVGSGNSKLCEFPHFGLGHTLLVQSMAFANVRRAFCHIS